MTDLDTLHEKTLRAFGQRDYQVCGETAYAAFPKVTMQMVQLLLISLQRLDRDDMIANFKERNLPLLARYPFEHAIGMLTLGLKEPREVRAGVADNEQLAAFHCYLGSRYLTEGRLDLAAEQFALCQRVPVDCVEKTLARWQATWPAQQPEILRRSTEKLAAATAELNRHKAEGRPQDALAVAARCFEEFRDDLTIPIRLYLAVVNNYALCQHDAGNFDAAEQLCRWAMDITNTVQIAECFETSVTWTIKALLEKQRGANDAALESFECALGERRRVLGEAAPGTVTTLINILIFLMELRRDQAAARYLGEAAAAFEQSPDRIEASSGTDLDRIAHRLGERNPSIRKDAGFRRYAAWRGKAALALFENASRAGSISVDDRREAIFGAELALGSCDASDRGTLPVDELHDLLARAYQTTGDYAAALPHRRAIADAFKDDAPPTMAQAMALLRLGTNLLELTRFEEASKTYERAMKIAGATGEPTSADHIALMNAAGVALTRVDPAKAEAILLEARDLVMRDLGGRVDLKLLLDQNRAACLHIQRKFSAMRALLDGIEGDVRSHFGETSFQYLLCLVMRGEACVAEGDFAQAEAPLEFVVNHPIQWSRDYDRARHRALLALAHVRAVLGRHAAALEALLEDHEFKVAEFEQVAVTATDVQRRQYFRQLYHELSILLTLLEHVGTVNSDLARRAWQFVMRCKAAGPEIMMLRRSRAVFGEAETSARDTLMSLRQRAATLEMNGCPVGEEAANAYLDELYGLRVQISERELELSNSVRFRNRVMSTIFVDAKQVAAAVPDDTAFVEVVRFARIPFTTLFHPADEVEVYAYLAFVVSGASKTVGVVAFGDADPIDVAVSDMRSAVRGERGFIDMAMPARDASAPQPAGFGEDPHGALDRLIVQPLLAGLRPGPRRLVIAPDYELCRLPFGALMNRDGEHLIDRFVIAYLASGRAILEQNAAPRAASAPLVLGNPDFEWRGGGQPAGGSRPPMPKTPTGEDADYVQFEPLPATMAEVRVVADLLRVPALTGPAALKSTAMAAHSPAIVHLATHGYFVKSEAPEGWGLAAGLSVESVVGIAPEHAVGGRLSLRIQSPLLRSGIVMAGANAWLRFEPTAADVGDGLLSAEDIAAIDLVGTQLVVLSACDTGLGDIRRGEGVLGLQRSFAIAGARTLVMSLWKVPDVVTCLLMETFYTNVLQRDMKIDEALRDAQAAVRAMTVRDVVDRYGRMAGAGPAAGLEFLIGQDDLSCPFVNEAYWGGFVCMGSVAPFSSRTASRVAAAAP